MDLGIIVIDISQKNYVTIPSVRCDSNTRFITVNVVNNGKRVDVSDYRITIGCQKPDGFSVLNDCTKVEAKMGIIKFEITEQMGAVAGTVDCELRFYNVEDSCLTTQSFVIEVSEAVLNASRVVSSDEFATLTHAISEVERILREFEKKYEEITEKFDNKYEEITLQFEEKFKAIETQFGNKFDEIELQFSTKYSEIEEQFNSKFQEITTRFDDKYSAIERQFSEKFQEINSEFENKSSQIDSRFNLKYDGISGRFNDKYQEIEEQFNLKLEEVTGDFDGRYNALEQKFNLKFEEVEKTFNEKSGQIDNKFNSKYSAIEEQFNSKYSTIDNQFSEKYKEIEDLFNNKSSSLDTQFRDKMSSITQEFSEKSSSLDSQFSQKYEEISTQFQAKYENLENEYAPQIANKLDREDVSVEPVANKIVERGESGIVKATGFNQSNYNLPLEIGRYIDLHNQDSVEDVDVRIETNGTRDRIAIKSGGDLTQGTEIGRINNNASFIKNTKSGKFLTLEDGGRLTYDGATVPHNWRQNFTPFIYCDTGTFNMKEGWGEAVYLGDLVWLKGRVRGARGGHSGTINIGGFPVSCQGGYPAVNFAFFGGVTVNLGNGGFDIRAYMEGNASHCIITYSNKDNGGWNPLQCSHITTNDIDISFSALYRWQ